MMKSKDYEPIKFYFFQSEIEKIQFTLGEAMKLIAQYERERQIVSQSLVIESNCLRNLSNIKEDIEYKIQIHRTKGEWL